MLSDELLLFRFSLNALHVAIQGILTQGLHARFGKQAVQGARSIACSGICRAWTLPLTGSHLEALRGCVTECSYNLGHMREGFDLGLECRHRGCHQIKAVAYMFRILLGATTMYCTGPQYYGSIFLKQL